MKKEVAHTPPSTCRESNPDRGIEIPAFSPLNHMRVDFISEACESFRFH